MLVCNRLCIDPGDGSPAVDYRIEEGRVESRVRHAEAGRSGTIEKPWQPVTPEQLRRHVVTDTVVARWLSRRMGIHQLIRACNQDALAATAEVQDDREQRAA